MMLQEQSLGVVALAILLVAVLVLGISYNKRLAERFKSHHARRAIDAIWGLSIFALAMWLILAA